MLFSGIPFLFYFLPVVLIIYFCVPYRLKNTVLLISSLFFLWLGRKQIYFSDAFCDSHGICAGISDWKI